MSDPNDDPVISYDPDRRIVTIDGFRFARELFSAITASPPGIRFRIISRENGVVALSQERDPLEFAAPELLDALQAMVNRWEPSATGTDRTMWDDARAAIAKATAIP